MRPESLSGCEDEVDMEFFFDNSRSEGLPANNTIVWPVLKHADIEHKRN